MTVAELIAKLQTFPLDLEVRAGMNGEDANNPPSFDVFRVTETNPSDPYDFVCIYVD